MFDALTRFRDVEVIAFKLIRWSDKQSEILRHFPFNRCTQVEEHALLNITFIEVLSKSIATNVGIQRKQVFIVSVYGCTQYQKIFFQEETGDRRREIIDIITISCWFEISHFGKIKRITKPHPVALKKFHMNGCFKRNVERLAFKTNLSRIGINREISGYHGYGS